MNAWLYSHTVTQLNNIGYDMRPRSAVRFNEIAANNESRNKDREREI